MNKYYVIPIKIITDSTALENIFILFEIVDV